MKKTLIIIAVAAAVAVAAYLLLKPRPAVEQPPAPPAPQPNVLLITVDTLRAEFVGCIGGGGLTPQIDSLAAQGTVFTRCITAATTTGPSHTSMLTGLMPNRTGVFYNLQPLPPGLKTLPQLMKDTGYRTEAFVSATVLAGEYGFDRGFDYYDDETTGKYVEDQYQRSAEELNGALFARLRDFDAGTPFFLWLHYFDPHDPYTARVGADAGSEYDHKFLYGLYEKQDVDTINREYGKIISYHKQEIFYTDRHIGLAIAEMERLGLLGNTMIVVAADHGEELFEHENFYGHARSLYDTVLRVPLIVALPDRAGAGRRVDATVSTIDIFATVIEAAGIVNAPANQGESLLALIGGAAGEPRAAFSMREPAPFHREGAGAAITADEWKLIRFEKMPHRLFNLKNDPKEHNDLADADPERAADMAGTIETQLINDPMSVPGSFRLPSDKDKKILKDLGYIQ